MNFFKLSLFFFGALIMVANSAKSQNLEENQVRIAFNNFKEALITERYRDAVAYTNTNLEDYYRGIKGLAMQEKGMPNPGSGQPLLDQFLIQALRKRVDQEQLQKMDFPDMVNYAHEHSWFSLDDIKNVEVGKITVQGETADGAIIYKGKETSFPVPFRRVGGQWKVDPLAFTPLAETLLKAEEMRHGFNAQATVDDLIDHIPNP